VAPSDRPVRRRLSVSDFVPPVLALAGVFLAWRLPELLVARPVGGMAHERLNDVQVALNAAPYVLGALAVFLAMRLNHVTLSAAGLLAVACHATLQLEAVVHASGLTRPEAAAVLSLLLPLSLALLLAVGEGWGTGGLLKLVLVPALAVAIVALLRRPAVRPFLLAPALPGVEHWTLPLAALVLVILYYGIVIGRRRPATIVEIAMAWVLLPLDWMLGTAAAGRITAADPRPPIAAGFALLILLFVVYRLYWQRVYLDELTGVLNRRAFEERLAMLGLNYTIAMVDVDHFKGFNDKWGHAEGDNVLRLVARHLYREAGGVVYRYGGEEFAVLYRRGGPEAAAEALDRARESLAVQPFAIRKSDRPANEGPRLFRPRLFRRGKPVKGETVKVTVSCGIAAAARGARRPREVLERADAALYRAKREGRDRVVRA
jgi:GGDEF domain-containing protein